MTAVYDRFSSGFQLWWTEGGMRNSSWAAPIFFAFASAFGTSSFRAAEVPIEGDASLFQIVRKAQAANIADFPDGELTATCRYFSNGEKTPDTEVHVRLCWSDDRAYWEFASSNPRVAERLALEGKTLMPTLGRMLYDGFLYRLHYLRGEHPGSLKIFRPEDYDDVVPNRYSMDLRPVGLWSKCENVSAWETLIGPHPSVPPAAKERSRKWSIRQQGDRVIVEHHLGAYQDLLAEGVTTIICSREFAWNVVEATYVATDQKLKQQIDWEKDPVGRVFLKRYRSFKQYTQRDGVQVEGLMDVQIDSFDGNPSFPPEQFTPATLAVKSGTRVDDRVTKRQYTYQDDAVFQEALERLGKKVREEERTNDKRDKK